jgi:hypothetical protein
METISLSDREIADGLSARPIEQIYVRSQTVVSRRVGGETLIVPVRGKVGDLASIYSFNGTGSTIWQALESPRGVSQLIGALEGEYEVERGQAQRDVERFLQDMLSVGLVETRPAAAMTAMQAAQEPHSASAL